MTTSRGRVVRAGTLLIIAIAGVVPGPPAAAGNGDGASTDDTDVAAPSAAAREEALTRFRRGVALYDEGDVAAAEVELTRAYELAPNFKLLFNLGQVARQRRDYAAALGYLTRYLSEGGDRVPSPRRLEVEEDVVELRQRVGQLGVRVTTKGFTVIIDDVEQGITPLTAPVTLNVGRHRVELVRAPGERHMRLVDVPGGQTVWVSFTVRRGTTAPPAPSPPRPERGPAIAPNFLGTFPSRKDEADEPDRRRGVPWLAWGLTAACAAGAAATGAMALSTSFELQRKIDSYPVSQRELDSLGQREREFALASDGLLLGTAVLSGIALYLTMSRPAGAKSKQVAQGSRAPAH